MTTPEMPSPSAPAPAKGVWRLAVAEDAIDGVKHPRYCSVAGDRQTLVSLEPVVTSRGARVRLVTGTVNSTVGHGCTSFTNFSETL